MELPLALAVAVLFAAGTSLILRPNLLRLVMGFGLYSNATNLLLITVGGYTVESEAPFVGTQPSTRGLMDPLPPDIILTAIVISFAVGALLLTLCYRVYKDHATDNPQELPVDDDYTATGELAPVPASAGEEDRNGGRPTFAARLRGAAGAPGRGVASAQHAGDR